MRQIQRVMMMLAIGVCTAPAFAIGGGKVVLQDLHVAADGSRKGETIEISSFSWGAHTPPSGAGKTTVSDGVLRFTASTVPPAVSRLCASHEVLAAVTVETDGQRRELRQVVFAECPAATGGTFTLTFNGQTTAPAAAPRGPAALTNVTITGFTRMKCQNNLKQIGIATHSATIYVGSANGGVWKTTDGGAPARGQKFPLVVIEGRGGARITFTDVTLEGVSNVVEPSPEGPSEVQKIEISFTSTTATPQLIDTLIAGR